MQVLTPAERRGALLLVVVLGLGAAHDLWRASHPRHEPLDLSVRETEPAKAAVTAPDSASGVQPTAVGLAPGTRPPLDLNRAEARELDALPGIGPVLAERIVSYRRQHGPFRRPEELMGVHGIGPRLFQRLRPWVTVGPSPSGR